MRSRWLDIGQVLFLRVYGPRRRKRTRPISSHLGRTNSVNKGFIVWLLQKFCLRDTAFSPERARWLHLARSGSQAQRTIWFILPARGASHEMKLVIGASGGKMITTAVSLVCLMASYFEQEKMNGRKVHPPYRSYSEVYYFLVIFRSEDKSK